MQTAFLRFEKSRRRFRGEAAAGTYLYRIALNLCRSEMRRRKSRRSVPLELYGDLADPARRDRELFWAVEGAIQSLKPALRTPLVLREMEGFGYPEIGRLLKISESGARTRVHRARKIVKARLEKEEVFL